MVFDPTFHEIDREAEELPDIAGATAGDDEELETALADDADEESVDAALEGEATEAAMLGDLPANELPPEGA